MDRQRLESLSEEFEDDGPQQHTRSKPQRSSTGRFAKHKRKGKLGIRGRSNFRSVSSSEKRARLG